MWRPSGAPFLLKSAAVRFKQLFIFCFVHLGEAGLTKVVDEDVLSTDESVVVGLHAAGVVIILEGAQAEAFIEGADLVKRPPAHRYAEHGRYRDIEVFAVSSHGILLCERFHLLDGLVLSLNQGLVASPVGDRANHADLRIIQMAQQCRQPTEGHDGVIV